MPFQLEYHVWVRHSVPASVALFGVALLIVASPGIAQTTNGSSSATASSSGHSVTGSVIPHTGSVLPPTGPVRPATGTLPSVNPAGIVPNARVTFSAGNEPKPDGDHHHHKHHSGYGDYVPYLYPVPVPYAVDSETTADDSADADDDAEYQGGPTVFDRRGSGAESYVPPVEDSARANVGRRTDSTPAVPDSPQLATLLVFKDGHTIELGNYAIVGAILFDLSPGHTRKVPLADIDLAATERQNDDRGVTFALPAPPQAN